MVKWLQSMHEALDSIPHTANKIKKNLLSMLPLSSSFSILEQRFGEKEVGSDQPVVITDWLIPAVHIQGPMRNTPSLTHLSPLKLRPQASSESSGHGKCKPKA